MSSNSTQKKVLETLPLKTLTLRTLPAMLPWAGSAFLLFFSFSLMVLHKAQILPVERMRMATADAVMPILSVLSAPLSATIDSIDGVRIARDLRAENIRLKSENEKLQRWYETAMRLQAENKSLRELLNVKADPAMRFITARIISDAGGAFVKSALLPVGADDRVEKGAAVLSGQGLVGRIIETGAHTSRALLITDLNSRIPVVIENTRTRGVLSGKNQDLLRLERLPPDSGILVGARVVTSGDGGGLPPDIPVGKIVSTAKGVWVEPLVDIGRVIHVQVFNTGLGGAPHAP